jgi:RNase P subunit RPR2
VDDRIEQASVLHVRNAVAHKAVEWSIEHERRSSTCPSCKRVRGNAVTVAVRAGQQMLTFRCPSCGAEWTNTRPEKASERLFTGASSTKDVPR